MCLLRLFVSTVALKGHELCFGSLGSCLSSGLLVSRAGRSTVRRAIAPIFLRCERAQLSCYALE